MQLNLRIAIWNANGLYNHKNEIEIFIKSNYIDICLISETHFTSKTYFKINNYDTVTANHPDERAHAGAAVLIKSSIKYKILSPIEKNFIQAAGVQIICDNHTFNIYSIYFPPKHCVKCEQYEQFFKSLGAKFIVGGDFNAKHTWWGSRLSNPKGKELYKCITKNYYSTLSTGSPTYWPSDPMKIPDLLDFFVYKGIPRSFLDIIDSADLSSDHSPVILTFSTTLQTIVKTVKLFTPKTNIQQFGMWVEENINLNIPIKDSFDLDDAVEKYTSLIHEAAFIATPQQQRTNGNNVRVSAEIRALIENKRRLRKIYQNTRIPLDKTNFNRAARHLTKRLKNFENESIDNYLRNLNVNRDNEHKLFNATKYLKRPKKRNIPIKSSNGEWCRSDDSKANEFRKHLEETFSPFNLNSGPISNEIQNYLDIPCQMDLPIKPITPAEIKNIISLSNNSKSPGYDCIDSKILKHMPKKGIVFLATIFNSIFRLNHFPTQWKYAKIVMILKPNKPENSVSSYRPISLLTTLSKIFERLFLKRLLPILEKQNIIPDYQFGFRHKHGTPEQCHRIVNDICNALERKLYCSAVFLDIEQAFDRVWHIGLLYKLKKLIPAPFYFVIKAYLNDRRFFVSVNETFSDFGYINAGIPQGSVLGPVLYTIFTSDMPIMENITTATYADDTAILYSHESPATASEIVQGQLNLLQDWLLKWNIKVNTRKSVHVTFTLRKNECSPVYLNGNAIPKSNNVKYLGLHLDRRLTWKEHIKKKREQLNLKTRKMYWLLGPKSGLNLNNKVLLYKTILKPIWTYGIQLWGTTSNSNIEILQRYQSKTLRLLTNAPWFVNNNNIHNDLKIAKVKEEIPNFSERYLDRLSNHTNTLAINLLDDSDELKRLKRFHVLDLPFRK